MKSFFFYKIHIYNLPFALALRLFRRVYVFKYEGLCLRLLNKNVFLSIGDFKDVDQWRSTREKAFKNLKEANIKRLFQNITFDASTKENKINFKKNFLQHFVKEYEQYIFFQTLVQNRNEKYFQIDYAFMAYLRRLTPELLISNNSVLSWPFLLLDNIYSIQSQLLSFLKRTYLLLFRDGNLQKIRSYRYICTGINSNEYPTSETELNFSWLVTNGIISANDILYVLETPPTEKTKEYLEKYKINFIIRTTLYASLPFIEKIAIIFFSFISLLKNSSIFDYSKDYQIKAQANALIWSKLLNKLKPKHFIFSLSVAWPEPFESSICNSLQINTINWFYGSGEFGFTTEYKGFSDLSVRLSIIEAKELWVWNKLVKKLLEGRNLLDDIPSIQVIGPILNGNWNFIKNQSEPKKLFRISVFDMTPVKTPMRIQWGEGPYCSKELQEEFYKGIYKIHETFSDVELIVKTKRYKYNPVYHSVDNLEVLRDLNSPRIHFAAFNSDPYASVAGSDLIISSPFTSPTLMALSFGMNGVFYDPIKIANFSYQQAFAPLTIKSEDELINFIQRMLENKLDFSLLHNKEQFPVVTIAEMEKNLKERLGQ